MSDTIFPPATALVPIEDINDPEQRRMVEQMRQAHEEEMRRQVNQEFDEWEEKFYAKMDKKPEIRSGVEFVDNDIPIPPLLVEPFFPTGGLALFHGKRGLGKTMMGMGLARAVATGEPFLNTFPTRQGVVVYMQLDMTDNVFQERLRQADDFYRLEDLYILTGVASIAKAKQSDYWVQDVVALQPELIIIDTLRKAHSWDENSSDTPARFYAKLRELFGWTSVMLIHHDRKTSETSGMNPAEGFRGSGAWIDDVDVGMQLTQKGGKMELSFSKVRVCEEIDPFRVEIDSDLMCLTRVAGAGVGKREPQASAIDHARDIIQAHGYEITRKELYAELKQAGWAKSTASEVAKRAMDQSFLT